MIYIVYFRLNLNANSKNIFYGALTEFFKKHTDISNCQGQPDKAITVWKKITGF